MTTLIPITARLPRDVVRAVDKTAREDGRSTRTDQLTYLMRLGLAARERMAEFERMAVETFAAQNRGVHPGTAAAAAHLSEHARLSGIQQETD